MTSKKISRNCENLITISAKAVFSSLYTDIPNSESIPRAIVFNYNIYLQIKVCAMGTICAPFYAKNLIAAFECKYIIHP